MGPDNNWCSQCGRSDNDACAKCEVLRVEVGQLKRERDEALRILRKETGCHWDKVIAQRALPEWFRTSCVPCKGLGEIPVGKWAAADGIEPSRCETCKGEGEIWTRLETP